MIDKIMEFLKRNKVVECWPLFDSDFSGDQKDAENSMYQLLTAEKVPVKRAALSGQSRRRLTSNVRMESYLKKLSAEQRAAAEEFIRELQESD